MCDQLNSPDSVEIIYLEGIVSTVWYARQLNLEFLDLKPHWGGIMVKIKTPSTESPNRGEILYLLSLSKKMSCLWHLIKRVDFFYQNSVPTAL